MAVTKVFVIRARLDQSVNYAANIEKTVLDGMIEYAVNPDKTEQRLFQTALNCASVETAFDEMQATKQRYGKMDGNLGYHFIQAFKPGEITPELAHQLGVELATRLLGGRFEAVIGTHLDRKHLHSHIMVNSVSFVDGKKFRCNKHTYFKEVQKISDDLCREHGLSIVQPKGKGKQYGEWKAEREGKPTIRGQIRKDMDYMVTQSLNLSTFYDLLRKSGYTVKNRNVKHIAIKPPQSQRFVRLDRLGENYTEERLSERILENRSWKREPLPDPKGYRFHGSFQRTKKLTGLRALYFRYVYLIRGARQNTTNHKVSRYLLEDTIKFDRYLRQHKFLVQNHIDTPVELECFKATRTKEVTDLTNRRSTLYTARRGTKEPERYENLTVQIKSMTVQMKPLRQDIKQCDQILKQLKGVKEKCKKCRELSAKQSKKQEKSKTWKPYLRNQVEDMCR